MHITSNYRQRHQVWAKKRIILLCKAKANLANGDSKILQTGKCFGLRILEQEMLDFDWSNF